MRIVWDEPKRLSNIDKHGLDFADIVIDFFLDAFVVPAKAGRFVAIGKLNGETVAVVFVRRGLEAVSVISMRSASRKERMLLK
ncbi:MAG: BrnT family toxin [Methylocystis sp.]|nr:BrnT family toxin [Methylocystis sp.]